ncbi:AMP-binding protein [Rhizomicrobium electricum]|uniref:Phospholipid/glycerol acyltransferase domain-containing protein n=1 Tax=Rhizomicrobium electricum TaxID=480070 RepID=A0ABP3Q8H7_9PROT|nr:AMP-binding protein [Rhizomicrobium electricum]NIJ49477.1 acyl-CoA synthetase (AMP-forming)/AMP-acid ligase II/1-acyl-sn-glycerol-3-phosphate acyltransferase [Rhizomicrobium electricum]
MAWLSSLSRRVHPFCLVRPLLRLFCRVRVSGLENLAAAGNRVLIVANHVSVWDAVLLSAFLPGQILFAMPATIATRRWLKPYWRSGHTLDQRHPITAKVMVDAIKAGRPCMAFPEGRVGRTGGLMKIYEGPGMIADKAGAAIVPIRIDGPQYSHFSELDGRIRKRLFPKITLTVLPAVKLNLPAEVKGHQRRRLAGSRLHDIMEAALVAGIPVSTLLRQMLASRAVRGGGNAIIEDAARQPLSHNVFAAKVFTLAGALARVLGSGEKIVGIMIPNGIPNATAIFAVQATDRVGAMINFSSGPRTVAQTCRVAKIASVVTLRAFVAAQHLEPVIEALMQNAIRVLYLEDILAGVTRWGRLAGWLRARLPVGLAAHGLSDDADRPAVLLFTSGTEGAPKGVMLSHRNIITNAFQFGIAIGFGAGDSVFACLPLFHSFGLTLGLFAPLFYGTRTFLYPSPLRYHDIPELVYDTGATLLLGTDTFLGNYARNAAPHDFYFLRFAIGGAEKIKPETRRLWAEKFGVRLFEGYGTTETAPVISVNTPLHYKPGSVGRAVSCLDVKLLPVEGIKDGCELLVRGPNLMLGYIKADQPGVIQPVKDGWYNTGDVVSLDETGFITILGRTKRFAKIGGEMVSLGAIEAVVSSLRPDLRHAVVSVQRTRKGEVIVLLTESGEFELSHLHAPLRAAGLTKLSFPRHIIKVAQIPLLGSGKTDYAAAEQIAYDSENVAG